MALKKLQYIDSKVLQPDDYVKSNSGIIVKRKPVIGKPKVYDLKTGKLLADEENLVVLDGREFLAQKFINKPNPSVDLRPYEIRYFGIGSGGASGTVTSDPQDTDSDLATPAKFSTEGINTSANDYKYIDNGYLKKIESDGGSIDIVLETLEVNTATNQTEVQKYTTIKFTLYVLENEPAQKPFTFNEAGLYAVKFDENGKPTNDKILVARFTTQDKNLGPTDGIIIEWSILV